MSFSSGGWEQADRWTRTWVEPGPVAAACAAATGRPSAGRLDPREDEVAVRAGELRLAHLVGVVAVVDEVLVDRDVPGVLGDRPVQIRQGLLLGVTGRAE